MLADLTVLILTFNEEKHIERCLQSLNGVATRVVIVDCFSTDDTVTIAKLNGADVLQHAFANHASQLNWALDSAEINTQWTMRLDADEILTPALVNLLRNNLVRYPDSIKGLTVNRQIYFLGEWIRRGSIYPLRTLRIWRTGHGRCENRHMDEHMLVNGEISHLNADIADINLNNITWWTEKHNKYASREAVDLLNLEYGFMPHDKEATLHSGSQAGVKRWLKESVYARLPGGFRALAYFLYRYVLRLGFLDGRAGFAFHFLQGFWYRYLVDVKVAEVKRHMKTHSVGIKEAIHKVLGIQV